MSKLIIGLLLINSIDAMTISTKEKLKNTLQKLETSKYTGHKLRYKLEKDNKNILENKLSYAKRVAKTINCENPKRVFRYSELLEKQHSEFGLDLWYECIYSSDVESKIALQTVYDNAIIDVISKVELDYEIKLFNDYPNDPLNSEQSYFESIELLKAWDFTTGTDNVVIQVIDTGIEIDHPDIQNNIWTNSDEICGNGIDDDNNGFIDDCHGYNHADNTGLDLLGGHWHGTHCGGIISASTNNNIGVSSISGGNNMIGVFTLNWTHSLIIINVLWLVFAYGKRFNAQSIINSFMFINVVIFPVGIINYFLNANYMFICSPPAVDSSFIIGDWPYYLLYLEIIYFIYIFILYLPFKLAEKYSIK